MNATVVGGSLRKSNGCAGCPDAGARSDQAITSGDGYVEFTISKVSGLRFIGLSNTSSGTGSSEIKFALRVETPFVEVRENGVYKWDIPLLAGDTFRIAVTGGHVTYARNGQVFYTSAQTPSYPLIADASLYSYGAWIDDAVIAGPGVPPDPDGPTNPKMALDLPTAGPVTEPFAVSGWALDLGANSGTGVDLVHVWAVPVSGDPIFLGVTTYGTLRPDVGAAFGTQFANSGFSLIASGLAPGPYRIIAYANSTVTNSFSNARATDVSVNSSTRLYVDAPSSLTHVRGTFLVGGWTADLSSASDPGIDAVHVYAYHNPGSGEAPTFLGAATLGGVRPDVALVFGPAYLPSGTTSWRAASHQASTTSSSTRTAACWAPGKPASRGLWSIHSSPRSKSAVAPRRPMRPAGPARRPRMRTGTTGYREWWGPDGPRACRGPRRRRGPAT